MTPSRYRLAVFAPHPVQYHAGIFRELAKLEDLAVTVFYEDRLGQKPVYVDEFKTTIKWDVDLLSGYEHAFIRNYARNPEGKYLARINPGVCRVIREGAFDAVLLQSYERLTDGLVFLASLRAGIPLLFRGEATLRPSTVKPPLRRRLKRLFLARFLRCCDTVLFSCSGNREYFAHYGVPDEKLVHLRCAVDNDFFQRARAALHTSNEDVRRKLGLRGNDFVIVFCGQMTPRKRPLDLIEAAARISREDLALLFIGDGPLRSELEATARAKGVRAVFTGFVNQGQISRYYAAGNLFALLSDYDNSPKALNEAMNFAMPVICTTAAGTARDLVVPGENGYLVEAGDVDAIACGLRQAMGDRVRATEMGCSSLKIVAEWNFAAGARAIREAARRACAGRHRLVS